MLRPGTIISERYEIIEKVGSGGMADVYKAKCHKLNRYVAFKVLKTEFSDDKNFVNKFREEAQACAGLSHPNIVNIYDVGDDGDIHFIVMELVEGITLKNYIERKGKLEIKEAVGIAIQIAKGMEVAHLNNIVHRDIKPQNIIISKEGKVKVTDFGIAKAINSNTITANTMGSVHYLSPEQARGGYSDEKSDIYSLGVTLYEMLSGRVPFVGDNTVSVALLHIQSEPIPLRELDPNIPVSIERIVQKAMQKKPERRYLSGSDLIEDLKKSIEDPSGNFVVMPTVADMDSPTITMSDEELEIIKNASFNKVNSNGGYNNMDPKDKPDFYDEELDDDYYEDEEGGDYDDDFLEEDADIVDPRMEKVVLIGTIVVAIVLVVVILFLINRFFNSIPGKDEDPDANLELTITPEPSPELSPSPEPVETFSMPYVINLRYEDAYDLLKQNSEDINITSTEDYSDTVEKGKVIEQYPTESTEIKEDGQIRLVISAGKEAFQIPDVSNYSDQQAVTVLTDMGLRVLHDYKKDNNIEEGKVISTNPASGNMAVKGDTITVLVSSGPDTKYVQVPDLTDLDETSARSKIEASGLSFGRVSNETGYSNRTAGKVAAQSHAAGTDVQEGTSIDIILSIGPEPTPTPTIAPPETEAPKPPGDENPSPGDENPSPGDENPSP
ncbi:MAG TPA: Stk1 family PASTA domain-containing Ser/Thr kinase, partial [Clostridiales bacterium]|nr:Stk1 family PASTA domain-containing Ser/Thr kinase [Clostridiales bacterium]